MQVMSKKKNKSDAAINSHRYKAINASLRLKQKYGNSCCRVELALTNLCLCELITV